MSKDTISNKPLVSFIIVAYNSSEYIVETLESAKNQTYSNIDLVIVDDASTDNTVAIVEDWLTKNKDRFARVKMVASKINGGIAANCNRGLDASEGEWLKYIAGDDTLTNNCIEDYVNFINDSNEPVFVVHSEVDKYIDTFEEKSKLPKVIHANDLFNNPKVSASDQHALLLRKCLIEACSVIYKREIFEKVGRWDEDMPTEDHPFWLRITQNGYKFFFLNKITANYRIHKKSFFNYNDGNMLFNLRFIKNKLSYDKYFKNNLFLIERFFEGLEYKRKLLFVKLNINQFKFAYRGINKVFKIIWTLYKKSSLRIAEKKIKKNIKLIK